MPKITACVSSRIQSGSPMKRMIGSWLMTGSENGSSTATSEQQHERDALRPGREDRRLGLVARVETRASEHLTPS